MICFLLLHTEIEGKYEMWLDYWWVRGGGGGGGTKDMLASPAKIIGGGGGASPSCSYAYVVLYTYRYTRKSFP